MKLIICLLFSLIALQAEAQNSRPITAEGKIEHCNPTVRSYCHNTKAYGQAGYGRIFFKTGPYTELGGIPVLPSGSNNDQAAFVGGQMMALKAIYNRKNRTKAFYRYGPVVVKGRLATYNNETVFLVTELTVVE